MRRWAANRVLLPDPEDVSANEIDAVFAGWGLETGDIEWWPDVLYSHCLTPTITRFLDDGDTMRFLQARQKMISSQLVEFLARMCEWDFEDTPPLQTLIMDDLDEDDDEPS